MRSKPTNGRGGAAAAVERALAPAAASIIRQHPAARTGAFAARDLEEIIYTLWTVQKQHDGGFWGRIDKIRCQYGQGVKFVASDEVRSTSRTDTALQQ